MVASGVTAFASDDPDETSMSWVGIEGRRKVGAPELEGSEVAPDTGRPTHQSWVSTKKEHRGAERLAAYPQTRVSSQPDHAHRPAEERSVQAS